MDRRERDHSRQACLLDSGERDTGFTCVAEGFGDNEINTLFNGPTNLLFIHTFHQSGCFVVLMMIVHPCVGDVAGYKGIPFCGHFFGKPNRAAVQFFCFAVSSNCLHFISVRIIGESDHYFCSRPQEFLVQLRYCIGVVQHDLRHVRTGLHITSPLEFKEVPLSSEHNSLFQFFQNR